MNPLITSDVDIVAPEPEPDFDEKQDVTIITPEESSEDQEVKPLADDFEAMKKKFLPEDPAHETEAEVVHTWNIKNWRSLPKREHSPTFECGGFPWKILFFPYGNNCDFASFYLEQGFEDKPPEDWYACVQFSLVLWNPNDPSIYSEHNATHRFTVEEGDWGFTKFNELKKLFNHKWNASGRPLIEDNAANMTAYVRIVKDPTGVLWHNFVNYDSKKQTGMVGLKNQGATCYLNSLLQSLFFTNTFRKAVYQIPTEDETDVRGNNAYALQRLFYLLQSSNNAVSTSELTQSFGWESKQIFEQQDVQELSRILLERMEERMKGTDADGLLPKLFVGSMKTYIACINVDYESSRVEDFWDLQLNVKGNKTLDDSFKDYIQVETMDGENKYFAEGYGLQDAKKGVIFEKFPNILHLQLKRFEYDIDADAMTKVYDHHEFPEIWDASPYLSENADRSEPYIYHLHGVLVHSGDINAGHYYAFLKPTKGGEFYKFDDDRVTRATKHEALNDNYGGDFSTLVNGFGGQKNPYTRTWSKQKFMSAYMLVYLRESKVDQILHSIGEEDVPPHLSTRLEEERIEFERRKRDRDEAHLYVTLHIGTDEQFNAHQGFDLFPVAGDVDPVAIPKVYKTLRTTTITDLIKIVAEDLGEDEDLVRPWVLVGRQNNTVRPEQPIQWPNATVDEALHKLGAKQPFRIWMEKTTRDASGEPQWVDGQAISNNNPQSYPILLFLKHFDAETQTLKGHGHTYIDRQKKISELAPIIFERMNWPTGTQLRLLEEIKPNMIEPMTSKSTFAASDLQDGDIVCFSRLLPEEEATAIEEAGNYTNAKDFYDYLLNKVTITFVDRLAIDLEESSFPLELSKKMSYDQMAAKVGEKIKAPPTHIRFYTVNVPSMKVRQPVRRMVDATLEKIMRPAFPAFGSQSGQAMDCLYFEVLELSLSELETKKIAKVTLLTEGITKEEQFDILVPKNGVMADIIPALRKKANLDDDFVDNLRFYESHGAKLYKELPFDFSVAGFNEFVTIYAERLPQEEIEAGENAQSVYAFHFDKEPNKPHGVPFKFILKPDEPFKDTRERLSKRTGIKGKQFEKVKFAIVPRGHLTRPEYLTDEDILAEKLGSSDDMLGLDHFNKSRNVWGRSDAMMIR